MTRYLEDSRAFNECATVLGRYQSTKKSRMMLASLEEVHLSTSVPFRSGGLERAVRVARAKHSRELGEFTRHIGAGKYRLGLASALADARHLPEDQRTRFVRELEAAPTEPIRKAGTVVADTLGSSEAPPYDQLLAKHSHLGEPLISGVLA